MAPGKGSPDAPGGAGNPTPEAMTADAVSGRWLTVPNLLSLARILAVPVFLWALLSGRDALALGLLVLSGVTDYLDGKIARRFGMTSRLGQLLDPIADRLYIAATLLGFAIRAIIPWWLVAALVAREIFMGVVVLVGRINRVGVLPVNFVGKAATFNLLYAFPLLLLANFSGPIAEAARPIGWAFVWWGTGLYWVAGLIYAWQLRGIMHREAPDAGQ